MSILTKSASDLGRSIESGELDPIDLAKACFVAIEATEDSDRIYARTTEKRAMEEARAASDRAKRGMRCSSLDGVPVSWKDLFDTKGCITEAGSVLLEGRVPEKDCTVLHRATEAGTVCLGKTHMSELAFSGLGINSKTATSPNPFDTEWAPGGSSSGAAASVSFGTAPIAIGSDTGGSVRIPSAWNSLVGLKTTAGLLPNDGVVPLCRGFDTVGPLAKTVEDATAMFSILANRKFGLEPPDIASAKLGLLKGSVVDPIDSEPQTAFDEACFRCSAAGASISDVVLDELEELQTLIANLFSFQAWDVWGDEIEANPGVLFEPIEERFRSGVKISRADHEIAWGRMLKLRKSVFDKLDGFDAVVLPTVAILPPKVRELVVDFDSFAKTNMIALRNTRIGNLLGTCAVTLPTPVEACGFMLLGKPNCEDSLLGLSAVLEHTVKWG